MYNSSAQDLAMNVRRFVTFFNSQVDAFIEQSSSTSTTVADRAEAARSFVERDDRKISWCNEDFRRVAVGRHYSFNEDMIIESAYRPFFPQRLAFDRYLNANQYRTREVCPRPGLANTFITLAGKGSKAPFAVLATPSVPCLHLIGSDVTVALARWRYKDPSDGEVLFDNGSSQRISNLVPGAMERIRKALGTDISDDDAFAYVYGVLHSPEFRSTFQTNLKKEALRIPLVGSRIDFNSFRSAGQDLLNLHVSYDTVEPYPLVEEWAAGADPNRDPSVLRVGMKKMAYPKLADPKTGQKVADRTRLIFNENLTLSGIPPAAHEYVVGTRSALEWIIDRYYVKTDPASGIVNDPNAWALEHDQPRYIVDLIKRVVTVSLRTVEIVGQLPSLTFGEDGAAQTNEG
jgi:predicted helicase